LHRVGRAGPEAVDLPAAADPELWLLVRRLPERQRWAVALHYVEDRSLADVAAVLGCSEGAVKTHLSRARATLARQLSDTRKEASS
jgi:RNA polymerase sigma factor (sigma-70 family)